MNPPHTPSGSAGTPHAAPPPDSVVTSVDELVAHFHRGVKAPDQLRIGLEHEKIGVAFDVQRPGVFPRPLPYSAATGQPQIRSLLEGLVARGWQPVTEGESVIALKRDGASVTLEPGGQFELSGRPHATAEAGVRELDAHLQDLLPIADANGIAFLACGFRPLGTWDDVTYMPKGRYRVMREYLPTRGRMGVEMMKRTATVQANLDYVSEDDALLKMRVGVGVGALVTALYAASPLVDGKPADYVSYRAACWLDTDPDRCGLIPFIFEEGAGFRAYAEWALDVPMFFVYRHGTYQPVGTPPDGLTFRRFMRDGYQGERATLADWELHLSTLFPEARLKQYVELRSADSGPLPLIRALPALWRGLFYSRGALEAAWALVRDLDMSERELLRHDVPRRGLRTELRGRPIAPLCRELVEIAAGGLRELGGDADLALLEPLLAGARAERCPADDILDTYRAVGGDPYALAARLRYR